MRSTLLTETVTALIVLVCAAACSSESGDGDTGTGSGGALPGSGGQFPGSGGQLTGSGGISGSSGGSIGPSGTGGAGPFGTGGIAGVTGGAGGVGGAVSTGGTPGTGGDLATGGVDGADSGAGGGGSGACCADGNCLCHGPAPTALTSGKGSFATANYTISTGTVHYPTDAQPPFAGVALCAGFTNTGPEMAAWGPFYASYGIVTVIVTTSGADQPDVRATKLLAAIKELKGENTKSGSALNGKLSDRFGISGYSMGGGGTTIGSATDSTLKTSIGLAAYGGRGTGIQVPTLLLCGASDTTAPCSMSQTVYGAIPAATSKMMISVPGATHFSWFGPTTAGQGMSGQYALAFQKVFLEGDTRWKPLLLTKPSTGTQTTNIQ
jgi:pimeloyl-ACP methyl ester carboxylesterase